VRGSTETMKNHAALRHPFSSASRSCSAASRLSPLAVALPHTSPTEPTQLHVISPCRVPARSAVRVRPVRRSAHRTPTATRRTPGTGLAAPPVPRPPPRRTRRWALSVTVSLTALSRSRGRDTRRCICVSPLASRAAAPAPYFTAYRRGACKSVEFAFSSVRLYRTYRIRSTALAWRRAGG
jgi:hypothetical protein